VITKFYNMSFRVKIFTYFSLLIIMLSIMFFNTYTRVYNNNILTEALTYSENELSILSDSIDGWLTQFKGLTDSLFLNTQLKAICAGYENGSYSSLNSYVMDMQQLMLGVYSNSKQIETMIFVNNDNIPIIIGNINHIDLNNILSEYAGKMEQKDGGAVWGSSIIGDREKLILCRKINEIDTYNIQSSLGYFILVIKEEGLYSLYKELNPIMGIVLYIYDQNGKILSSMNREAIGGDFNYKLLSRNERKYVNPGGGFYYYVDRQLKSNNWTIVYIIDKKYIDMQSRGVFQYMLFITLFGLIISLIISYLFSNNITKPVTELARNMKKVENGKFDIKIPQNRNDEIGQLIHSYNVMTEQLNELVNNNLAMQIKTKEAQIRAYEMQINPHFIYNSLETIRMLSVLEETDKVDEAVLLLSSVLRFNLNAEKEVTIESELKNIEYYLRLLKLRFNDDFDYEINVDDEILSDYTLKFILQPIVENAMKHGIEKVDRKGVISILAKRLDKEIVFVVKDNGIGIEDEKIKDLKNCLNENNYLENKSGNIGLMNVHQRIKLFYGDEYGIEIESKYSEKTSVLIHIPSKREKRTRL